MEEWPRDIETARRMAKDKPYVESEMAEQLPLTGNLLVDAINQTGLSVTQIDRLRRETSKKQEVICEQLVNIGLNLGGGLDAAGKRLWLEAKLEEGLSLDKINRSLDELKDSPAT